MPSTADVPALLVGLEVIWVESSSCSTAQLDLWALAQWALDTLHPDLLQGKTLGSCRRGTIVVQLTDPLARSDVEAEKCQQQCNLHLWFI